MVSHKNYRKFFFAFSRINHCDRSHFSQISSEKQSSVTENSKHTNHYASVESDMVDSRCVKWVTGMLMALPL